MMPITNGAPSSGSFLPLYRKVPVTKKERKKEKLEPTTKKKRKRKRRLTGCLVIAKLVDLGDDVEEDDQREVFKRDGCDVDFQEGIVDSGGLEVR